MPYMEKIIMKLTKIFGIVLSLHVGVILLVMFQPSCQTADKKKAPETGKLNAPNETPLNEFNKGTETIGDPQEEVFVAPSRPKPGEIIIPGNEISIPQASPVDPLTPVPVVPDASPLRPTDLSIYKVVRGDTLWGIARKNSISLSVLLSSNPLLSKSSKLSIGQEIMIPSGGSISESAAVIVPTGTVDESSSSGTYVVKAGDSLSRIARNNQVSLAALMQINGMNSSSIIRPGQTLLLPETSSALSTTTPVIVPAGATTHIVKKGENLTRISRIYGVSIKQIMALNGLSDPGKIRVGQSLVVSGENQSTVSDSQNTDSGNTDLPSAPAADAESTDDSLQNFFKGTADDRPLIDAPDNP